MELIFSFMAIGAFCVVAATIEAILGKSSTERRLEQSKRHHRSRS